MRTGKNPAKSGISAYVPQELGIALIVYIPFTEGYFRHSLEILKYQIASIRETTSRKFDLLIFDNGSCHQIVSELKSLYDQKWINWLILSQYNLGKAGAWNWIFASMPNELICYSDSDVLFRPGWLEASQEIMKSFPQAGMVAAQPNFFDVMRGEGKAHLALERDKRYEFGEYLPAPEIVEEYCLAIGASEELASQFHSTPLPSIAGRGAQAVVGASHMQFLITRQVARQVAPLPASKGLLRSETMALDYKIDDLGYLHLSTLKPYVFHMGNTLTEPLRGEIKEIIGASISPSPKAVKILPGKTILHRWLSRLAGRPALNKLFLKAYNLLFQVLYAES